MENPHDLKRRLRAKFAVPEMDPSRDALPAGGVGFLLRVTLAVLFLYLVVISHAALGIAGPAIVSLLYLLALLFPVLCRVLGRLPRARARGGHAESKKDR